MEVGSMKEKYKFGYSDPRAMYGEPKVEWEFLEPSNRHEWLAKLPWIGAAILVLLMLL
jgi:hypothetical protein